MNVNYTYGSAISSIAKALDGCLLLNPLLLKLLRTVIPWTGRIMELTVLLRDVLKMTTWKMAPLFFCIVAQSIPQSLWIK